MKSVLAILFCALCAFSAFGLFLYQSGSGQLSGIFGKPALLEGTALFPINKKAISRIEVRQNGQTHTYSRLYSYWSATVNGQKVRADYAKLEELLFLIETTTVQAPLPGPPEDAGDPVELTFTADSGLSFSTVLVCQLPKYTGEKPPYAPSFVIRFQDGRYYACTSDLRKNFPDLSPPSLIDHKPFFFHPSLIREVTYQKDDQKISLSRLLPDADWKITSPIKLRTDPEEVKTLIDNLYNLEASKLTAKSGATPPDAPSLLIKSFTTEIPNQQLFFPSPETATQEEQPFTYHIDPAQTEGITPSIDALRSKVLTEIEVAKIDHIVLQSDRQKTPVILKIIASNTGSPRWMYRTSGNWLPANEVGVARLLTALTKNKVQAFSLEKLDSPTDAERSVTINNKDGSSQHFDLFRDSQKRITIQQQGVDFSAIISPSHAQKIVTEPTSWKDNTFWDLSAITLKGIQRQVKGRPTEVFSYSFNLEQWRGEIDGREVTKDIDNVAANAYLNLLETLTVNRWMSAEQASRDINNAPAVANIITISQKFNDLGEPDGLENQQVLLYPMATSQNLVVIRLVQENKTDQFGIIDKKIALRLIAPITSE